MITSTGIEVLGIGIQSSSVEQYYSARNGSSHVVVRSLDNLATEIFKLLKASLLEKRRAA
jgi:hypothetical protein